MASHHTSRSFKKNKKVTPLKITIIWIIISFITTLIIFSSTQEYVWVFGFKIYAHVVYMVLNMDYQLSRWVLCILHSWFIFRLSSSWKRYIMHVQSDHDLRNQVLVRLLTYKDNECLHDIPQVALDLVKSIGLKFF